MYRIMLADDEGIVTNSLSFVLNKNFQGQFDIETVKSGRGAIETAEHFNRFICICTSVQHRANNR